MLDQVREEARQAAEQICEVAKLQKGQILVVGCSTSEVAGHKVGSSSSPEIGKAIFDGLMEVLAPKGIYLAAQCCEHLNRAIIVEGAAVPNAEICNVVPQPKAGSSFATAAYHGFSHPVAVEFIRADAGLDIDGQNHEACGSAGALGVQTHRPGHPPGGAGAPQVHRRRPGHV